jgi:MFS family permease
MPAVNGATRTRYKVVGLTVLLAMVTYLDRACLGTLAPAIMRDLALSKGQMGWVYSAFALAYAGFEIPTAWWADRFGTRRVLTRIVVWWSSFTIATAAAFSFGSLVVIRFLFGAGEAGAWPSVARTFSRWIPRSERGTIKHGFADAQVAVFAGLPLLFSVVGDLLGGVTTDAVTRRFGLRVGRAAVGGAAYLVAGVAMVAGTLTARPMLAGGLIAAAVGASMFTLAPAWGTCQDIGGNDAAVVSAAMNTSAQVSSIISPLMVTFLLGRFGDWNAPLLVMGALFLVGGAAWAFIDPRQRLFDTGASGPISSA